MLGILEITYKGIAGEKLVEADLIRKGYTTFTTSIGGREFDLVAFDEINFYKVQVKCGKLVEGTKLYADVRKPTAKERIYKPSDFDVLAIVNLDSGKVAYFPYDVLSDRNHITVWLIDDVPGTSTRKGKPLKFSDHLSFPFESQLTKEWGNAFTEK